ncbi:phage terminase large subunit [Pendulispora brunnea]|uniref:Phage terminase large subunit n=1 Tax=Pendulispora brunnea TaxID=2905690 RepID=A0ABZ2KKK0_9BACT
MSSSRDSQRGKTPLALSAEAELERRSRARAQLPLLEFVPALTPRWSSPAHLGPICEFFERIEHEPVRALFSVPPQHGKTEALLHGAARYLRRHGANTVAYASYAARFAHSKSRLARDYARQAGVRLRTDTQAVDEWRTTEGGGFLAAGIDGPLTGYGAQLIIVDDPHKNRAEAESEVLRDGVQSWFRSTALSRLHPGGSVIIVHTRWVEDDLIGRLSAEARADGGPAWEYTNLPAISDAGALWPSHRPLDWLETQRLSLGEYDWWSLYQGSPRPRGLGLFRGSFLFDPASRPTEGFRVSIGADFAYSTKKRSDYSVALVLARLGRPPRARYYVLDVVRVQVPAPEFRDIVAKLCATYAAQAFAFIAGIELGIVDFFRVSDVDIQTNTANSDKYVRAQPVAAAWNDGRVLIPQGAPWASELVRELIQFPTARHDDQVDALAAAFTVLEADVGSVQSPVVLTDLESAGIFG